MKTMGLIGGTGWASSVDYYTIMNTETNRILKGHHFSRCILYSLNFHDVVSLVNQNAPSFPLIYDAAQKLIRIGAEGIVLCANSMHKDAEELQNRISVPVIHIATETAVEIQKQQLQTVGLIGTRYTMEMEFFKSKLDQKHITCFVPPEEERVSLHTIIMDELVKGIFQKESRQQVMRIIDHLKEKGIEGIILGCTEFPILLKDENIGIPAFDTTVIHAKAAVQFALSEEISD